MSLPARTKLKILFLTLFSTFLFLASVTLVHAQTNNAYNAPNTNPDVPKNLHTHTQSILIEVMSAMTCQLVGVDPTNPNQKCLGIDAKTGKIGFVENGGGAIGFMGNMITMTFTPPLHLSDYTRYLANNFGITKPAYAQGVGFTGLSPLLSLWTTFRNIVYLFFVAVFVIVGFAIMLRVRIDPRTVMTIGNQLPKLVVGLLLVTFSFAIAGGLIDLMYVSTYFATNIIESGSKDKTIAAKVNKNLYNPPIGFVNEVIPMENDGKGFLAIAKDSAEGIREIIQSLVRDVTPVEEKSFVWPILSGIGDFFDGRWVKDVLAFFLAWLGAVLAFLIILIALLWALLRLWFQLIMAYVSILISVVFGPFFILFGLFPGSPAGFGMWLRDIVSNLSVFPVTIIMFLLGKVFMEAFSGKPDSIFIPPLIGNPNVDGNFGGAIGSLIGLGIILMTPQVVAMMKELLKAPEFKYGAGVGQALGVGPGLVKSSVESIVSPYSSLSHLRRTFGGVKKEGLKGLFPKVEYAGGPPLAKDKES